jgi:hypothetical protein
MILTKSAKVVKTEISISDLCDEERIPYLYTLVRLNSKGKKQPTLPQGYQKYTYEQAMAWNEEKGKIVSYNKMCILLRESKYMVVDFDDGLNLDARFAKYGGNNYVSKSSSKGLPHLWRVKDADDWSKNATKIDGEELDFIYSFIFERRDAKMTCYDATGDQMPLFDYKTHHPKPIDKSALSKSPVSVERTPPVFTEETRAHLYRLTSHLNNHAPEDIASYTDWFSNGNAIKSSFPADKWFEILKGYSSLSSSVEHNPNYVDYDVWETMFDKEPKCGIPTILAYSKKNNESEYERIETEYRTEERKKLLEEGKKKLCGDTPPSPTATPAPAETSREYEAVKQEFEKTHFKIMSLGLYTMVNKDGSYSFVEPTQFKETYRHMKFDEIRMRKNGKLEMETLPFLKHWLDDEKIKTYRDVGVYPPPEICPADELNLWTDFAILKHTGEYVENKAGLAAFKKHVFILSGNDEKVADYLIKWLAQMFQFPAVKSRAIVLISNEGAGKGRLLHFIASLMGLKKVLETTKPSQFVWGQFNGQMENAFLVNLNEMSLKEAEGAEGWLKGLITDSNMLINEKGIKPYPIISYHRFLTTSNSEHPVKSKKDDRRNLIIRSSDELIGKTDYFDELSTLFDDISVQRTVYDYLMSIKDMDKFNSIKPPMTEHQEDIQELSRCHYDTWLEYYTFQHRNETELRMTATELCNEFIKWLNLNKIKYETNAIKFGLALKRLNIEGVSKKKSSGANIIKLDYTLLKTHYKITSGCLIDLGLDDVKGLEEPSNYVADD